MLVEEILSWVDRHHKAIMAIGVFMMGVAALVYAMSSIYGYDAAASAVNSTVYKAVTDYLKTHNITVVVEHQQPRSSCMDPVAISLAILTLMFMMLITCMKN